MVGISLTVQVFFDFIFPCFLWNIKLQDGLIILEHCLFEVTNQLLLCSMTSFECKITTELPRNIEQLLDLANGPETEEMKEINHELFAHGVARGQGYFLCKVWCVEIEENAHFLCVGK